MALLLSNILWPGPQNDPRGALAERMGIDAEQIESWELLKRSVDGRRRPPVWLANYKVELRIDEGLLLGGGIHGLRAFTDRDLQRYDTADPPSPIRHPWPKQVRPIVVGAGPAGLFAALRLAEAGAPAVLLERGGPVEERHHDVRRFWRHGELDPESNVVFGEGGAGAFSDGKIYTRRRDGELGWIFRRLVRFGADPQILEEGWAHLGTDRIREILPRLRAQLIALGVECRFRSAVTDFMVENGRCTGVRLMDGSELQGGPVIVAAGHSARDTWTAMLEAGAEAVARPIHLGARIEHPQKLIDRGRYGGARGDLPPASYRLTSNPPARFGGVRKAHTFCMCPGGTVVAASNHPGRVVVNGMSYSGRKAWFANSAVIVEVGLEDYGASDPLAGVRYQDAIEQKAWELSGGEFRAPAQRVSDLLAGRETQELPRVSYTNGVCPTDLRELFSAPLIEGLVAAIRHFDRRIPGFAGPEGILIAPETRTTAPLRFPRRPDYQAMGLDDLLPVGEGAGHAGGIVSAGLDGLRAAEALVDRFCPRKSA
jgi:uncharacterized FAD-dependent dehydrogenase